MIAELGARDVSTTVIVEAWKAKNRTCDEQFFMHFDVLCNYQFIKQSRHEEVLGMEQLLEFSTEQDNLVSITHEGHAFFERYGG